MHVSSLYFLKTTSKEVQSHEDGEYLIIFEHNNVPLRTQIITSIQSGKRKLFQGKELYKHKATRESTTIYQFVEIQCQGPERSTDIGGASCVPGSLIIRFLLPLLLFDLSNSLKTCFLLMKPHVCTDRYAYLATVCTWEILQSIYYPQGYCQNNFLVITAL